VAQIQPLRGGPDGVHQLTVQLNPVELGPVSIVAELRDGDIHLRLAGATEAAREALRAALPDLRRELADAGLNAGTLDVWQQAAGDRRSRGQTTGARPGSPDHAEGPNGTAPPDSARPLITDPRRVLDLHV
jgi:flagellar hook-length control protein FliK